MKRVEELSKEELCREIAEQLRIVPEIGSEPDKEGFAFYDFIRNGEECIEYSYVYALDVEDAWSEAWQPDPECGNTALPNWARDTNKTLKLCYQIAYDHHWLFSLIWSMNGDKDGRWLACFENRVDEHTYETLYHGSASDPALACARSALLALRGPDAYRVLNEDLTEIDEFEKKYNMSSEEFLRQWRSDEFPDTFDGNRWAILLTARYD